MSHLLRKNPDEEIKGRLFDAKSYTDFEKSKAIAFELINAEDMNEIQSNEKFVEKFPKRSAYFSYTEKNEKIINKRDFARRGCYLLKHS